MSKKMIDMYTHDTFDMEYVPYHISKTRNKENIEDALRSEIAMLRGKVSMLTEQCEKLKEQLSRESQYSARLYSEITERTEIEESSYQCGEL